MPGGSRLAIYFLAKVLKAVNMSGMSQGLGLDWRHLYFGKEWHRATTETLAGNKKLLRMRATDLLSECERWTHLWMDRGWSLGGRSGADEDIC